MWKKGSRSSCSHDQAKMIKTTVVDVAESKEGVPTNVINKQIAKKSKIRINIIVIVITKAKVGSRIYNAQGYRDYKEYRSCPIKY